jgi:hypothetical protein
MSSNLLETLKKPSKRLSKAPVLRDFVYTDEIISPRLKTKDTLLGIDKGISPTQEVRAISIYRR